MSQYTDLYLHCSSKEDVAALLSLQEGETLGNYYENEQFVLDWIGLVPEALDEEGNVTAWAEGLHFNVYAKPGYEEETNELFNHFEKAFPYTPFRRLAKEEMQVELPLRPFDLVYENINKFNIQKVIGPYGEENDLKVEVFYALRRTEGDYRIRDVEVSSQVMPYTLAPGLDIMSILDKVKNRTATQFEYGIINQILQQFNEAIRVIGE